MIKLPKLLTVIRNTFHFHTIIQNRTLYTPNALGIDGYITQRGKVKNQFISNDTKFREKMKEYVNDKSSMIFTEDLKNMVHLADKNDVDLVIKMLKKFHSQNKEIQFGNYIFGPVVMRMFHHLEAIDSALQCFNDKELDGFFDYAKSYQILLDLLFINKRYNEILKIYDLIRDRSFAETKGFKHVTTLTFAACYKLKNNESFEYCSKLWKELHDNNIKPMRRVVTFAAGLALEMNAPHIALEIVSSVKDQNYLTVRNIKAQAFAELDRPEDVLPILRSVLEIDDPASKTKRSFTRGVIERVRESIKRSQKSELETDFYRIEKYLNDNGHITEETLDDLLCKLINDVPLNRENRNQSYITATFSNNKMGGRGGNVLKRRGLQDLY